jgi:hypothetical protein
MKKMLDNFPHDPVSYKATVLQKSTALGAASRTLLY